MIATSAALETCQSFPRTSLSNFSLLMTKPELCNLVVAWNRMSMKGRKCRLSLWNDFTVIVEKVREKKVSMEKVLTMSRLKSRSVDAAAARESLWHPAGSHREISRSTPTHKPKPLQMPHRYRAPPPPATNPG